MEKTGVVIGRDSWLLLRDEPLYSARFIDRDGTDELALVVRVEEIQLSNDRSQECLIWAGFTDDSE